MSDKPKPGDPDYNIILDKLSWEETPRTVVIGVVGLVPKVGGVFSKLLGLIWPDPKGAETLIKESEAKMKAWVKLEIAERIAKYDTEKLRDLLEGLRTNLKYYGNDPKESWLNTCIGSFNLVKPMFLNPQDYIGSLPFKRWGHFTLAFSASQCFISTRFSALTHQKVQESSTKSS
jgi:hypothetical protein